MSTTDRRELTIEEAYELVRFYVNYFWTSYAPSLRGTGEAKEDVVQDVMVRIAGKKQNKDYNPSWNPGEPLEVHKGRGSSETVISQDTSYMLEDDYDPEDPYDSLYHLAKLPEISYIEKYDGRTTSKKYYIQRIVQTVLIDKTRKRDLNKSTVSMDVEDEDGITLGDRISDERDKEEKSQAHLIGEVIKRVIEQLDTTPLSDRIVGWSPITGQYDEDGNKIETPLTARDIGIFIMNSYEPSDVAEYYYDVRNGNNVSVSTIRKKWNEALDIIRNACLADKDFLEISKINKD